MRWLIERTCQARELDGVLVATDDERIAAVAREANVEVAMTDPDLPSGTDRIAAAIQGRPADVVINIQGDEPLIDPALIDSLARLLAENASWDMATAASPLQSSEELANPDVVRLFALMTGERSIFARRFRTSGTRLRRPRPLRAAITGTSGFMLISVLFGAAGARAAECAGDD